VAYKSNRRNKRLFKSFRVYFSIGNYRPVLFSVILAFIGLVTLIISQAASDSVYQFQAEEGGLGGGIVSDDSQSSSGKFVKFDSSYTDPVQISDSSIGSAQATSNFKTGVTYTQAEFNQCNRTQPEAWCAEMISNLNTSTNVHVQHLMGFGTTSAVATASALASPDWQRSNLNFRINGLMGAGSTKVLTACCAPWWMKGGGPDDDFGNIAGSNATWLHQPPEPRYYDEYATFVEKALRQFTDIRYVQVWNEMKGMYFDPEDTTRSFELGKNYDDRKDADPGNCGPRDPGAKPGGRWNYECYTNLYNQIWTKVSSVNSTRSNANKVKVGGPYVVVATTLRTRANSSPINAGPNIPDQNNYSLEALGEAGDPSGLCSFAEDRLCSKHWGWADEGSLDVIKYWLKNKNGADFVSLDIKNHNDRDDFAICDSNPQSTGCAQVQARCAAFVANPFAANQKFADYVAWIRYLGTLDGGTRYPGASNLPVWYSEWYARAATSEETRCQASPTADQGTKEKRNALMTDGLVKSITGGAETAIIWQSEGNNGAGDGHPQALFSTSRNSSGDSIKPSTTLFFHSQLWLRQHFGAGVGLRSLSSLPQGVTGLASDSKILLVNTSDKKRQISYNSMTCDLAGYAVILIDRATSSVEQANSNQCT
jgi:hypothetical protein